MANWIIIQSSHIHRVRYFRVKRLLVMEFKDRQGLPVSIYVYGRVPWKVYMGFLRSESKGEYHARYIKKKYDYQFVSYKQAKEIHLTI